MAKPNTELALNAASAMYSLRHFMSTQQKRCVRDLLKGEEGDFFAHKMIELARIVETMPKSYEQSGKGDEAIVSLHYFAGGAGNWWITEKDAGCPDDEVAGEQHQAFGLANFYGGPTDHGAEIGYISIAEIIANDGQIDFHFQPRTLRELKAGKLDRVPAPAVAAALVRAL
jgi:hypothetical protein